MTYFVSSGMLNVNSVSCGDQGHRSHRIIGERDIKKRLEA